MNAQLEALIEKEISARLAKDADKEIGKQNAISDVRNGIRAALGVDLHKQFVEQGLQEKVSSSPGRYGGDDLRWSAEIIMEVNGSDEHHLCPITIRAYRDASNGKVRVLASLWHYEHRRDEVCLPEELVPFLTDARFHWRTWRKDRAEKELQKITMGYGWKKDDLARLEELKSAYPEAQVAINEQINKCNQWFLNEEKQQEQRRQDALKHEADQKAKQALIYAEVQRFIEFTHKYNAIMSRNIELRKAVQAKFDEPISICKLVYGICSEDEEGLRYADTSEIYVLHEAPLEDGYWLRYDGQKLKIFHPVSVEPMTVRATSFGKLSKSRLLSPDWDDETRTPDYGVRSIQYFPWLNRLEAVNEAIEVAGFELLPVFQWSEELPDWDREVVERTAAQTIELLSDRD